MAKRRGRPKNRDNNRRAKKKVSILTSEKIQYVDWKDSDLLRKFMSDRAKIRARRVTGNSSQQQKLVADAIKLAREMALVPYASRVTTQRQGKDRVAIRRPDGSAPRPSAPPPGQAADVGSGRTGGFSKPAAVGREKATIGAGDEGSAS